MTWLFIFKARYTHNRDSHFLSRTTVWCGILQTEMAKLSKLSSFLHERLAPSMNIPQWAYSTAIQKVIERHCTELQGGLV